jgi:hypothetical protein
MGNAIADPDECRKSIIGLTRGILAISQDNNRTIARGATTADRFCALLDLLHKDGMEALSA